MLEDDLFEITSSVLLPLGCQVEAGDEMREPPLEVLRYYTRPVRFSWIPILGKGISLVVVARQPIDIAIADYPQMMDRISRVINTRFPPAQSGNGLSLGFTTIVTTPEPIRPEDDAILDRALMPVFKTRAIPLGLLRVNLGQEAVAFALRRGPVSMFPEPDALADAFSLRLKRFAALLEM